MAARGPRVRLDFSSLTRISRMWPLRRGFASLRGLRQSPRAALRDRPRRGRHDRADVALEGLVDVDDDRGVVTGAFAFARLAVDPGGADAIGDRVGGEDQVDPHPEVAVEHAGAVVPVGEDSLVRPAVADDIAQAQLL